MSWEKGRVRKKDKCACGYRVQRQDSRTYSSYGVCLFFSSSKTIKEVKERILNAKGNPGLDKVSDINVTWETFSRVSGGGGEKGRKRGGGREKGRGGEGEGRKGSGRGEREGRKGGEGEGRGGVACS